MQQISIIIPVYNEDENIGPLLMEVFEVVSDNLLGEIIVVDDASTDTSAAVVARLIPDHPKLRLLRHTTNAGKSAAVRTAASAARFSLLVTMDGDGQNPPGDIAHLVAAWSATGPQLVGGHRTKRRDTMSKRIASRLANGLRRALLRDDCPDTACGFKVFERDMFLSLPFFDNQNRYLPALFRAQGCTAVFIPVNDRPRLHGRSKYTNLTRAIQGIPDLLGVAWLVRRARPVSAVEDGQTSS